MCEQPTISVFRMHRELTINNSLVAVHSWGLVSLFNRATLVSPPVTVSQDLVMSQYTRMLEPLEDIT